MICPKCGRHESGWRPEDRCQCPPGGASGRLLPGVAPDSEDDPAIRDLGRKTRETIARWHRQGGFDNVAEIDALIEADEREKEEAARIAMEKGRRTTYLNDRYELETGHKPPVLETEVDQSWSRFIAKVEAEEQAARERAEAAEERRDARRRRAAEGVRRVQHEADVARRAEAAAKRASQRHAAGYRSGQPGKFGTFTGATGGR